MSIQNIMNVCFAICITLFIYQNQQLKSDVELLEFKLDTQEGTKKISDVNNLTTLLELEESIEAINKSMEDALIQRRMLFKRNDEIVAKLNIDDERETKNTKTLNQVIEAIKFNEKRLTDLAKALGDYFE